jgi:type II secretory pathway predicted ATPase ExeA
MYQEHFGLKDKPFEPTADPKYIWIGNKDAQALRQFRRAFLRDEGCLILSGDVGTGKTMLMSCFLKLIENYALSTVIWDPALEPLEFLNLLAFGFRINQQFENRQDFLYHFKSLVENAYLNKLKLLIVIDEAQNLRPELVLEVNRLMNIVMYGKRPVSSLFLIQRKKKKSHTSKNQNDDNKRVVVHHHMEALSPEDTCQFINHRLKVAGADTPIFTPEALQEIFKFSAGNPRLINLMCDRALLTAYAAGTATISNSIVLECARELGIPRKLLS